MKRLFTSLLLLLASSNACASYADIWWNPNESGWGVTFAQQQNTIFATFFIYGPDSKPFWVASVMTSTANAATEFNGPVYSVVGSPYAQTFDPSTTATTLVGTARVKFITGVRATLTYSINGVQIAKTIERQTLATLPLAGSYTGQRFVRDALVSDISGVESITSLSTAFILTTSGNSISIRIETFPSSVCMYAGTYTQYGVQFSSSGTYQCSDFSTGTWTTSDLTILDGTYLLGTIVISRTTPIPLVQSTQRWMGGRVGGR